VTDRHRASTRAVILDPNNKFLLFLSRFDPGTDLPPQWVFPGGGLEQGEEPIAGVIREVFEETGRQFAADAFEPIEALWHPMDDVRLHDTGEAHFFELKVSEPFEPSSENWTDNEHRDTVTHRWVSISEILSEQLWVGPSGAIELLIERYGSQGPEAPPHQGS
jgi:8-oxo-dGTP pyrophosphatase MutT (NUDIX family)